MRRIMNAQKHKTYVVLHNIRSAHNVGSIFRTAEGAGASKIFLVGHTPTPIDRFGRTQPEIAKTALGAEHIVPYEYVEDGAALVARLQKDGATIVAVEQHARAVDYKTFTPTKDTTFIFGNEIDGVSEELCKGADAVIEIPMAGEKESLNVGVSAGVILFHFSTSTR